MFLLGFGLPIGGSVVASSAFPNWQWADPTFHTFIELIGALLALALGILLLTHDQTKRQSLYFWVGCGLIGMGILDVFHAFVEVGKVFVWFHSTAVFLGGVAFLVGASGQDFSRQSVRQ